MVDPDTALLVAQRLRYRKQRLNTTHFHRFVQPPLLTPWFGVLLKEDTP